MFIIGNTTMYGADDICKSLHVTKETAYRLLALPQANAIKLGRKILISEQNLLGILSKKAKI